MKNFKLLYSRRQEKKHNQKKRKQAIALKSKFWTVRKMHMPEDPLKAFGDSAVFSVSLLVRSKEAW